MKTERLHWTTTTWRKAMQHCVTTTTGASMAAHSIGVDTLQVLWDVEQRLRHGPKPYFLKVCSTVSSTLYFVNGPRTTFFLLSYWFFTGRCFKLSFVCICCLSMWRLVAQTRCSVRCMGFWRHYHNWISICHFRLENKQDLLCRLCSGQVMWTPVWSIFSWIM